MSEFLVQAAEELGYLQVSYHDEYEVFSKALSHVINGKRQLVTNAERVAIDARALELAA